METSRVTCACNGYLCCKEWMGMYQSKVAGGVETQDECPCFCHLTYTAHARSTQDKDREKREAALQSEKNARMEVLAKEFP
jgi:hypothetical protein